MELQDELDDEDDVDEHELDDEDEDVELDDEDEDEHDEQVVLDTVPSSALVFATLSIASPIHVKDVFMSLAEMTFCHDDTPNVDILPIELLLVYPLSLYAGTTVAIPNLII